MAKRLLFPSKEVVLILIIISPLSLFIIYFSWLKLSDKAVAFDVINAVYSVYFALIATFFAHNSYKRENGEK